MPAHKLSDFGWCPVALTAGGCYYRATWKRFGHNNRLHVSNYIYFGRCNERCKYNNIVRRCTCLVTALTTKMSVFNASGDIKCTYIVYILEKNFEVVLCNFLPQSRKTVSLDYSYSVLSLFKQNFSGFYIAYIAYSL